MKDIKKKAPKPTTIKVKAVHVEANNTMSKVVLSNGAELQGILQGGLQVDGAEDNKTKEKLDVLSLQIVGKFEIVKPTVIEVKPMILGRDGRPV